MNKQVKRGVCMGTHPTISTVIIAALVTAVPTSAVRGQYTFPAGYDWKAEIEQTFGLSSQDVEQGSLTFFLEEDCPPMIEKYGSCFGNNPASPYGMYELGDFSGPADAARWRLAEHQAVLFIGMTPPTARYYSLQTYPFSRHEDNRRLPREDGEVRFCDEWATVGTCLAPRQTLVGKIGLNLNHLEILTDGGDEESFEKITVVVTTANRAVEARIRQLLPNRLAELGISPNIINIDPIPCASTTGDGTCDDADPLNLVLGSEPESDDLLMAIRLSMAHSLAARQAYMDALEWLAEQIRLVYNPPEGGRGFRSGLTSTQSSGPAPARTTSSPRSWSGPAPSSANPLTKHAPVISVGTDSSILRITGTLHRA